jgi:hypothetical protein
MDVNVSHSQQASHTLTSLREDDEGKGQRLAVDAKSDLC